MRGADKLASYRALAAALRLVERNWHLTLIGDGPDRADVAAMFAEFGTRVTFVGAIEDATLLRHYYERADALVWPGVNEAYGMVYLEAQAAGTPVIAEDWPGPRAVIAPGASIVPRGDTAGFAAALSKGANVDAGRAARAHVLHHHGIEAAARRLGALLGELG